MSWRPDRYAGLRTLLRGVRVDEEVRDEFEHHLALRIEANVSRGMSPEAARDDALRRFGDLEQFRRQTIDIDESVLRERKRMEFFDTLFRELKQSVRGLRRSFGFSSIAIFTLALGIGATTAVFTLLDRVVLNPLPYAGAERLVRIDHAVPSQGEGVYWPAATASYFHYKDKTRTLSDLAAYWPMDLNIRTGAGAFEAPGARVSPNLFTVLGAQPRLGRFFREEESIPGATHVVVISHELWQREYASDQAIIGKTLRIDGEPVEIIGVAPAGFGLPDIKVDVWLAKMMSRDMQHANWHHLELVGVRKPGVEIAAVQSEMQRLTSQLPEFYPGVYDLSFMERTKFSPRVLDLRAFVVGDVNRVLWIILGSVAVVLLIACANVANLFLVRNETRRGERAVRTALGADRAHLAVQSFSESFVLAVLAGLLGVLLAYLGLRALLATAPADLPRLAEVRLGGRAIAFTAIVSAIAGLVFGVLPLIQRGLDFRPLREGGRGMTTSKAQLHVRSTLVTAQIALAMVLLAAAGLMLRTFDRLRSVESGINAENVLAVNVSLPFAQYGEYEKAAYFWRDLSARLREVPGVQSVGASTALPFARGRMVCAVLWADPVSPRGDGCISNATALPGFYEAMGITITGRAPSWSDIENKTGAIVISRSLAQRLWPDQDPIGKGLRGQGPGPSFYRIVGVAEDVRYEGFDKAATQIVYFPPVPIPDAGLWQPSTNVTVVLKSALNSPEQLAAAVRRTLIELEPGAAIGTVDTMERIVARSMVRTTFTMILLGVAGLMALLLSVVGLYGVISYLVSRRRAEIGIRMALGAARSEVGAMIVMQSVRMGAIGVILGLFGSLLTTQMLSSMLFDVAPTDPTTLTVVAFLLLAITALAAFIPARRAAAVSPVEALRQ